VSSRPPTRTDFKVNRQVRDMHGLKLRGEILFGTGLSTTSELDKMFKEDRRLIMVKEGEVGYYSKSRPVEH